jgi:hypothetical protein
MNHCVCSLLCVLGLTGLALAGDKTKPNTLTEKEIADGWLLLFDGETTFGWNVQRGNPGKSLKVADSALDLGELGANEVYTYVPFRSFEMRFDYQCDAGDASVSVVSDTEHAGPGTRLPEEKTWKNFDISIRDRKVTFNGAESRDLGVSWKTTWIFYFDQGEKSKLKLRNIKLKPLGTRPLFNGKDLTGWKVLPGNKSVYSVTKEGYLNVKDGRGDIQTTDTFKDFVLQLECISNGDNLNSGIFFRGLPGEYQQGYEAQIHNGFKPDMPKTYKVDKYDPKTHEKTGTDEVKSAAVDFGTGAIYRRIPARKQMAKDKEWFAMTVVAHGNHFATWVNGVQVVDWTDNRPPDKNGRNGFCANPGVISIQGHDPTTDLSFRNIRIAEYP